MTNLSEQDIRIIFGLKLKQLRTNKEMSLAALAQVSGLSPSYLNEIEKGKKYPKQDKIIALSEALGVHYDKFVSLKLDKNLAPIGELLRSNVLNELPLELFGLEPAKLIELIAEAPTKINAFIATLIKIARNYEVSQEHFYLSALRSYQEMHDNYFEDIEQDAEAFLKSFNLNNEQGTISYLKLQYILEKNYNCVIDYELIEKNADLQPFRTVMVPSATPKKPNVLYINKKLSSQQRAFVIARELGYFYLGLDDRPQTSAMMQVKSFEQVLSMFKASYFAGALLLNRHLLKKDMEQVFAAERWDAQFFVVMMEKYQTSAETFMHRLTNILPKMLGVNNFFFLRFDNVASTESYVINKELHFSQLHLPHSNELREHYCRRWGSITAMQQVKAQYNARTYNKPLVQVQKSRFLGTKNEYLVLSIARPINNNPLTISSVNIGFEIDADLKKRMKFLDDSSIDFKEVNRTCQRCELTDCTLRMAPPTALQQEEKLKNMQKVIQKLSE
jgi:transcriptional regulator with XRE-family HTH domain/predicted transcriptional regulator